MVPYSREIPYCFYNTQIQAFDGWFLSTNVSMFSKIAEANQKVLNDGGVEDHEVISALQKGLGSSFVQPNLVRLDMH